MGTASGRYIGTSYFNGLRTSVEDVLRVSVGDVPWRYIEDHIGTFIGRLLGRRQDAILPSGIVQMLIKNLYSGKN